MIDQVQSVSCNAGYIKHSITTLSICVPTVETYYLQQKLQFPGNRGILQITNPLLTKIMYRKLFPFNEHKGLLNYMTTVFAVGCLK